MYSNDNINFHIPENSIIDYKEAIVFAFIGLLRYLNKTNIYKSVTGAVSDSSGGDIISNGVLSND